MSYEDILSAVLAKDPRYPAGAYAFAQECLDHAVELRERGSASIPASEEGDRHISGGELCEAFRDLALERFGLLARDVLASWGIEETRDLGNIVFNLIDVGAMRANDDDRIEDFDHRFDFEAAFSEEVDLIP